ncbi:MAG: acyl-CoA thioesterase [Desulfobulbus sp.]|nr:MAG: acyl-CoA thioesterase [Desulfobulbus sp.]
MADLQAKMVPPVFTVQYRVLYVDTDAGGVVNNGHYLRFFEMGRSEMMRKYAVPYSDIEQAGLILPVTESYLRYKAPAVYDDLITIATSLAGIKRVSCRFHYRITCKREGRERLLVKGFTNHACVNRAGKLVPFPDGLREKIAAIHHL